jgi:hypothetical protein
MRTDRVGFRRIITGLLALVLLGRPVPVAAAEDASAGFYHHAGLQTGSLYIAPPGRLVVAVGVEYLPDVTNELAGVRGQLLRIPTVGLRLGLSDNAEFQVSWPAYNRLRVKSQTDPPPLGVRLDGVTSDFGDVFAATILQLYTDNGRWPDLGLKFAARLPNSNEKKGIGDNTTDVFASILASRSLGDRLALSSDLGLGILSARTASFIQNDVFTYGVMSEWRASDAVHVLGEVAGRQATHLTGPGTGSRSELRAGVEVHRGDVHYSALLVHGLTELDSQGVGVSLNVSTSLALLKRASKGSAPRE